MKISWNYLQSLFAEKLDKANVLERLTMAGLEVEEENPVAPVFSGIVVGEVIECEKHPDADKLSLCKVDAGTGELLQIICGASNVAKGVKIPCAKVGAVLPGDFKIAERKMRGIVSYGMLCSGNEIGCPDDVDGLLLLPQDAPIGMDIREYLDLNDTIVEFKITPNRGDCLSYAGLAREIAVLSGAKLLPVAKAKDFLTNSESKLKLNVEAKESCPHYVGLEISGVNNSVSTPKWMANILLRSGVKSISPIVDITNYVMLRLGQPMHAFDLAKINGGIGVRMATNGEELKLLDGKDAKLVDDTLVIVDGANKPVAIAGVMGGLDSGVTETTQNILLESAFFTPHIVAGKTKKYGVNSDSAFRFERGVDTQIQHDAINLATSLVLEICGGEVKSHIHFNAKTSESKTIQISFTEINSLVGEVIAKEIILNILNGLGLCVSESSDVLTINVPSYRFDLSIKQDIVEEIIRVYGYDKITAVMPKLEYSLDYLDKKTLQEQMIKRQMVDAGFNEVINYAFVEEKYDAYFAECYPKAVKLLNPIAGLSVMRTNLLSGLVKTMQSNINRGHQSIKLFELAKVFHGEENDAQHLYLAGLLYGTICPLNWAVKSRNVDFYDLKAHLESVLAGYVKLGFVANNLPSIYHPGRSACVLINGKQIGFIGQLHPKFAQELSVDNLPYVFEINMDLLLQSESEFTLNAVSKYQKVSRDLALVVDKNINADGLLNAVDELKIEALKDSTVFDVFVGGNLADNVKSVAINFIFHADYNLADDEVNGYLEKIKQVLHSKFNAELR